MWHALCRNLTYPLWDLKDGRGRLSELRTLQVSQTWDTPRLRQLQLERLRSIVEYAYRYCDFYRQRDTQAPRFDRIEDIRALPLVNKSDISGQEHRFLSSQFDRSALIGRKTGGSTGVALRVFFDETCEKKRNAAAMRTDGWAGWTPGAMIASLWGSPPVPATPKEKLRNLLHDRVCYLDTMHLDPATMGAFAAELHRRRARILFGHAHSLFIFARFLRDSAIAVPRMHGIISTSMMLIEPERRVIEQVFGCAVTNRYGCEEVGLIASECEVHRGMHLNSEHVIVEFLRDDDSWAAPGGEGRIVVTDLINHGMPLIRYAVGDRGIPSDRACACGRGLPLMEGLTGRSADFLRRRDGVLVAGVSLVEKTLTAIDGIEQLQIIQDKLDEFLLNVVPAAGYGEASEKELRGVISDVFGPDARIQVAKVDRLSQDRNTKYRFAICRV
jgi:phenylacetate-coenzyme A ligase PaaK-like adenylate-forming protein